MTRVLTPQELLDAHPEKRIVSLDFFDTLVTRSVVQPTHVFAQMERQLVEEFGYRWRGFARTRVNIEHDIRVSLARDGAVRDVSHDEILSDVQKHYQLSPEMVERLRNMECDLEVSMARPVPFGVEVARIAMQRGLRVVIVSDNYMPSQHIVRMAHAAGLSWVEPSQIFVSCEHGGMKQNGSLWKTVVNALGVPASSILHLGDHEIPDHTEPSKLGIACHVDARSSQWHRHSLNTMPDVLAFSRLEAWQRDTSFNDQLRVSQLLGGGVVAMMVAAQVKDCLTEVKSRNIAGIHFAARDGWMANAVWQQLRHSSSAMPDASYLSFSRSVIGRANIRNVNEETAIRFIDEHEELTPRRLSQRFGCPISTHVGRDEKIDSAMARRIMLDNSDAIVAASSELRHRVIGHLRTNNVLTPGHHIVVDLGWRGSTMADMAELVTEATNGATTIEGRFLGLYWDATMNRVRLPLHGYAMDDLGPLNDNIRLLGAVRLFEFLVTAPHGSVVDFQGADQNFEPVYASQSHRSSHEATFIDSVLSHAVDGAVQILENRHPSGVAADDITPESVWAAMMQVAHTPRADELDALTEHVHVASVDHADGGIPIVAPAPTWSSTIPLQWYSQIYDDTMKTRWFQGSLRDWHRHESSRDFAEGVMRLWPFMGPVWCDAP